MSARVTIYGETLFSDRKEAGALLAAQLEEFRGERTLVLGVPRGGVVVAAEVSRHLGAELDILLSRKLSAPESPELAIGSITEDGTSYINETMAGGLGIPAEYIEKEKARQVGEISRRVRLFRRIRPKADMAGRTVIVVDDGVATGATLQAALWSCGKEHPLKLVCAFPAGSDEAVSRLEGDCDLLVVLSVPPFFAAVSQTYLSFPQVTDQAVLEILEHERERTAGENRKSKADIGKDRQDLPRHR